jgi:hypothetical protein
MKTYTWVVTVSTGETCTHTDYTSVAGEMCNLMVKLLTCTDTLKGLTVRDTWESCSSEIEVCYNGTVTGSALIDLSCDGKATLTKARLLAVMRAAAPQWPGLSVTRRNA